MAPENGTEEAGGRSPEGYAVLYWLAEASQIIFLCIEHEVKSLLDLPLTFTSLRYAYACMVNYGTMFVLSQAIVLVMYIECSAYMFLWFFSSAA